MSIYRIPSYRYIASTPNNKVLRSSWCSVSPTIIDFMSMENSQPRKRKKLYFISCFWLYYFTTATINNPSIFQSTLQVLSKKLYGSLFQFSLYLYELLVTENLYLTMSYYQRMGVMNFNSFSFCRGPGNLPLGPTVNTIYAAELYIQIPRYFQLSIYSNICLNKSIECPKVKTL